MKRILLLLVAILTFSACKNSDEDKSSLKGNLSVKIRKIDLNGYTYGKFEIGSNLNGYNLELVKNGEFIKSCNINSGKFEFNELDGGTYNLQLRLDDSTIIKGSDLVLNSNEDKNIADYKLIEQDSFVVLKAMKIIAKDTLQLVKDFSFELIPNPLIDFSSIRFGLPYNSKIKLKVFGPNGFVNYLIDDFAKKGTTRIEHSMDKYNYGIYFFKLSTDSISAIIPVLKTSLLD